MTRTETPSYIIPRVWYAAVAAAAVVGSLIAWTEGAAGLFLR
jgi:hypothetical protein